MQIISLNGKWTLEEAGQAGEIPAEVPGSVYGDLLKAGRIPDPFWRDNEVKVLPLMERDWRYSRRFDVPARMLANEKVLLCCHGLDTLAEIEINGLPAG